MLDTSDEIARGYISEMYIRSLAEFGTPRRLEASGGWCLQRPIPGSDRSDAMGAYPLFSCNDWAGLNDDLEALAEELVSFTAVCDPLSGLDEAHLHTLFPDLCKPYKCHYVAELSRPREQIISKQHQRNVRSALQKVRVSVADFPGDYLTQWCELYGVLRERHDIQNMSAFSEASFAKQLAVPGTTLLMAESDGKIDAMQIWYRQGDRAYYHLGASSARGYEMKSAFALFWTAFELYRDQGVMQLEFGGAAGLQEDANDGLARFKRGWCNRSVTAYLCGRILDHDAYRALSLGVTGQYFPLYRSGEFA